jgi:hypothetical protein
VKKVISKPAARLTLLILLILVVWGMFALSIHTILQNNTLGADFATFWIGSRAALLEGKTPYSQAVTDISQETIYHRPAKADEDQLAFAYPLPSVFLLLPVVWMPLDWAQAFWMSLNILSLLSFLFYIFPKTGSFIRFGLFLFYPVFFGIVLGNFAILVSAFILVFLQEIFLKPTPSARKQIWAGILLSFCIIKPQFAWGYLLLAVLISFRFHLKPFLSSFILSSLVLTGASLILQPSWPFEWVKRVTEYATYVKGQPILLTYLHYFAPPDWVYPLGAIILACVIGLSVWAAVQWWHNKYDPLLLVALAGGVTYLVHPHGISYEQITFLLPVLLWAANSKKDHQSVLIIWGAAILLSWILFFVTALKWNAVAVNDYPYLFYLAWLGWIFWQMQAHPPLQPTKPLI